MRDILVGGFTHFMTFNILGIVIPADFHIFQRVETTNQSCMSVSFGNHHNLLRMMFVGVGKRTKVGDSTKQSIDIAKTEYCQVGISHICIQLTKWLNLNCDRLNHIPFDITKNWELNLLSVI